MADVDLIFSHVLPIYVLFQYHLPSYSYFLPYFPQQPPLSSPPQFPSHPHSHPHSPLHLSPTICPNQPQQVSPVSQAPHYPAYFLPRPQQFLPISFTIPMLIILRYRLRCFSLWARLRFLCSCLPIQPRRRLFSCCSCCSCLFP